MVTLASLHVYPVKSCRVVDRDVVALGSRGLAGDREFMVVDRRGRFVTQRTHPRLAQVVTAVDGAFLSLQAPATPPLRVPLEARGHVLDVEIWRDRCRAVDAGDAAADWLSAIVVDEVRLVRVGTDFDRRADSAWSGAVDAPTTFQDGFPLLVCNLASLADLNRRMPAPLPMARFRPNLVLDGLAPWEEDRIACLEIGAARLALVKPCTRCVITATDPLTGERANDPVPMLRAFRFDRRLAGVTFGENAVIVRGVGEHLRRGDPVRVIHD